MNYSICVRLWGAMDVGYVLWRSAKDISESSFPFFGSFFEPLSAAETFGLTSVTILTGIAVVVTATILVSGPLMIMLNRAGVYLSLVQFPFRLAFMVPPTFFFVQSAGVYLPIFAVVLVVMVLEVLKAVTQILWLRRGGLVVSASTY